MTDKKFLLKSQQGELDAVPMYINLAKRFEKKKNTEVAGMLRSMASDEGRHASVFKELSGQILKPKKLLAIVVPKLMSIIGEKIIFKIIAKNEYGAYDTYAPWVKKYSEIGSVQADERKHGDMAMKIASILK